MSDSMDLILLSPAQQQWLDRWGRWLDRAAVLDREHQQDRTTGWYAFNGTDGWDHFGDPIDQMPAGAIVVRSRAAAEALAAEMNAEVKP